MFFLLPYFCKTRNADAFLSNIYKKKKKSGKIRGVQKRHTYCHRQATLPTSDVRRRNVISSWSQAALLLALSLKSPGAEGNSQGFHVRSSKFTQIHSSFESWGMHRERYSHSSFYICVCNVVTWCIPLINFHLAIHVKTSQQCLVSCFCCVQTKEI